MDEKKWQQHELDNTRVTTVALAPPSTPGETFKVNEICDVTKNRDAPMLERQVVDDAWDLFVKLVLREARPVEEATPEQLSALCDNLRHDASYVDLAISGPHQIRTVKSMKFSGMVMGSGGALINQ